MSISEVTFYLRMKMSCTATVIFNFCEREVRFVV